MHVGDSEDVGDKEVDDVAEGVEVTTSVDSGEGVVEAAGFCEWLDIADDVSEGVVKVVNDDDGVTKVVSVADETAETVDVGD